MAKTRARTGIRKMAFTAYEVSDLDRAREFYEDKLGLESTGSYGGTWEEYEVNGETFAVWKKSYMTPGFWPRGKSAGMAFEVENIRAYCETLKEKGVAFLEEPVNHEDHCITAYIKDPDDNVITLHELL